MNWFAKINGQVYGPYSDEHMHGFVAEGRITANSQISNAPANGFFDAISFDVFSFWSGSGQIEQRATGGATATATAAATGTATGKAPSTYAAPKTPSLASHSIGGGYSGAYADHAQDPQALLTPATPSLIRNFTTPTPIQPQHEAEAKIVAIMAEIRGDDGTAFAASLRSFGPMERIGDTLWLVKTQASAQELRNRLSQSLSRQDRMFILGGEIDQSAWFNIGADLDHRIRALFDE